MYHLKDDYGHCLFSHHDMEEVQAFANKMPFSALVFSDIFMVDCKDRVLAVIRGVTDDEGSWVHVKILVSEPESAAGALSTK